MNQIACIALVAIAAGTIGSIIRIGRMEDNVKMAMVYSGVVVVGTLVAVGVILGAV